MSRHTLDAERKVHLTGNLALVPSANLLGSATVHEADSPPAVLGAAPDITTGPQSTLGLSDFVPAQPAVELNLAPLPPAEPAVLGAVPATEATTDDGVLEFRPDPAEGAVYALLHEIQTPDGTIYDLSLPRSGVRGAVLGSGQDIVPGTLSFPVNRLVSQSNQPPAPGTEPPQVLGGIGEIVSGIVGSDVIKHVVQVVKAPIDHGLRHLIERYEGEPYVTTITPDGALGSKIEGAEAWRAAFAPTKEHRVLMIVHGFMSSVEGTLPAQWIREFGGRYDAVLGYNHPTITRDPVINAAELLALIPSDLRLNVDLVVHSRGGLVARSLVELQPGDPRFKVQRMLSCGSPHAGTLLADSEQWDRLISIGFTAASWLSTFTGMGAVFTFAPRILELLLRAGSQFVLDLPGVQAMDPNSTFLKQLNAPSDIIRRVDYAAVVSSFDPATIEKISFRESLRAMAAKAFMRTPNDLVVPTVSMSSIDLPGAGLPPERIFQTGVDHFTYFSRDDIRTFAGRMLHG